MMVGFLPKIISLTVMAQSGVATAMTVVAPQSNNWGARAARRRDGDERRMIGKDNGADAVETEALI